MKNIFILAILGISIFSCKPKQTTSSSTEAVEKKVKGGTELTVDEPRDSTTLLEINTSESNNMKETGDPYSVLSAKIIGHELWLSVSYGGGCKEHQFELLFNQAYPESENEYGETSRYINLTLKHNANNDMCRSIVQQNIRFNLKRIQDNGSHEMEISVSGWEGSLKYEY
jgi:hypothetical protein